MNPQAATSSAILKQLVDAISELNDERYASPVVILSGNSIGNHIRHIIEFYECLISGYENNLVDYDTRKRNEQLEISTSFALNRINEIDAFIQNAIDKPLNLQASYSENSMPAFSSSSFYREVIYNIEHAIHHMAIIKIAVNSTFPEITLPANFGIAFSTLQHLKASCAQ